MTDEILWHVELTIQPDHLDKFRSLTQEMIEATALEEGVLVYERFLSEDTGTVFVVERYINSQAAVAHLRTFSEKFGEAFARLVKRERFLVFGSPSDELREILSRYGATFSHRMGGFSAFQNE